MIERLAAQLRRHRRIALDTSIFIYHLEANPRYAALADAVFAWLERPGHTAVASTVAMTELLVAPYRNSQPTQADAFYVILATFLNLEWVAPDLEIAALAAELRAQHGLKTSDAIMAATGLQSGATLFVTNDRIFRRVAGLAAVVLEDLL